MPFEYGNSEAGSGRILAAGRGRVLHDSERSLGKAVADLHHLISVARRMREEKISLAELVKRAYDHGMDSNPTPDANQAAKDAVDEITGQRDPVNGEDLLGSEELKRQLREAREREKAQRN